MSAAPQLDRSSEAQINPIGSPSVRRAPRPAQRKAISLPTVLTIASIWAVCMFLAFSLVQKNAAIREANVNITRAQHEITQWEQYNLALEGQIANAASVAEVERWALAHGMQQPTGLVKTLPGREEAVAVRTPDVELTAAAEVPAEPSIWQAIVARFTGGGDQAAKGAQ